MFSDASFYHLMCKYRLSTTLTSCGDDVSRKWVRVCRSTSPIELVETSSSAPRGCILVKEMASCTFFIVSMKAFFNEKYQNDIKIL